MKSERRKKERVQVDMCYAHFSEGDFRYTGIIEDVSTSGLRVRLCPVISKFMSGTTVSWFQGSLIRTSSDYLITISGNPDVTDSTSNCFTLKACPRWRKKKGGMMIIGFNIVGTPTGWEQFIEEVAFSPDFQISSAFHYNNNLMNSEFEHESPTCNPPHCVV